MKIALLEVTERLAADPGYDEFFISTVMPGELLQRKDWQQQGEVEFLNGASGRVYVSKLTVRQTP